MKILIVNQVFYPDETAVSQYITDFAENLAKLGHHIDVLSGIYDYEKPSIKFPSLEDYHGIHIKRIGGTNFSAKKPIPRLLNFFTFNLTLMLKLLFTPTRKYDIVLGSSVPPMAPVIIAFATAIKRIPFAYWVMDLQPDAAIALGYLNPKAITTKIFFVLGKFSLHRAKKIVVLDRFMKKAICDKGIPDGKVDALSLWSSIDANQLRPGSGQMFRKQHQLEGKTVVMYSGNHSICHPLDTLLDAAIKLKDNSNFVFVFVGGGIRTEDVRNAIVKNGLNNVIQLPYQPKKDLTDSLCAADIHISVMGDSFNGLMHPSKTYGIFATGRPFIFIGPPECHIADMINTSGCGKTIRHNETERLIEYLEMYASEDKKQKEEHIQKSRKFIFENFSLIETVEKWESILQDIALSNG